MSRGRSFFLLAAILGLTAVYFPSSSKSPSSPEQPQPRGRNNTVLVLSDSHPGFANVLLATSQALLLEHSDISIDFVSFPSLASSVSAISSAAMEQASGPKPKPITFHSLSGNSYVQACNKIINGSEGSMHPPGIRGVSTFSQNMQEWLTPWSAPEYIALYQTLCNLLEEIDPAIVAIDPYFAPALNAIRKWGGNYVVISPNSLQDTFGAIQPRGEVLWKYPM
jgi:hypothetical protein